MPSSWLFSLPKGASYLKVMSSVPGLGSEQMFYTLEFQIEEVARIKGVTGVFL